jgi:stress-induced-phosphoprotein 1
VLALEPANDEAKDGLRRTASKVNESSGEADDERARRGLADPEIQAILRDPIISQALDDIQNKPGAAQKIMSDPGMRAKIEKLIAAGVLRTG